MKDLAKTEMDPLARSVRRILREQYGFKPKGNFGIPAVLASRLVRPGQRSWCGRCTPNWAEFCEELGVTQLCGCRFG